MLNLNNADKKSKRFMYQNLQKSKCYHTNFAGSNFDYACFRGAHLKACSFYEASFKGTEFAGANFKDSNFRNASFENAVFEGTKLEGVDFMGAKFKNVIFVGTPLDKVLNLDLKNAEIRLFESMPEIEVSEALTTVLNQIMNNPFVKKSRVLDTKDKTLNTISVMLLLEQFDENVLINALHQIEAFIDRDFYTLSYISKLISKITEGEA